MLAGCMLSYYRASKNALVNQLNCYFIQRTDGCSILCPIIIGTTGEPSAVETTEVGDRSYPGVRWDSVLGRGGGQ